MAKVSEIAGQLRQRVLHGDYLAGPLPSERVLAKELGCSYLTARRAAESLIAEGLLLRNITGRLIPALEKNGGRAGRHRMIGFLADAFPSSGTQQWHAVLEHAMQSRGERLRMVYYHHWDAPDIREAVQTCDESFLLPCAETPPPSVMEMLKRHRDRITVLEYDWSDDGFHCITPYPPRASIRILMEHLRDQGYTSVDAVNVQPVDSVVKARIAFWERETRRLGMQGELCDIPAETGTSPFERALEELPKHLAGRLERGRAFLGITLPGAMGIVRMLYNTDLQLGRDVGVCTIANGEHAKYLTPSITCIDPDAMENLMAAQNTGFAARSKVPRVLSVFHGMSTMR